MDKGLFDILAVFSFAMGACIASFLNVVIWRVPRGESIVSPPSHCPKCNAAIRWYQNLPIVSWLALRGKCANCKAPISPRYICVETLGGVLFLAAFVKFGVWAPLMWVWISLMIAGSFIDIDHQLLPDFVTVWGAIYGLVLAVLAGFAPIPVFAGGPFGFPLFNSLVGLAAGAGLLWLVGVLGKMVFKREAMGLGDVFLVGAIGAIFGPLAAVLVFFVSAFFGAIGGLVMILLAKAKFGKFTEIPYGPYICLSCLVWMFYGPELVALYLKCILPPA